MLIGNANSTPMFRICSLFSDGTIRDNSISEGTISASENSNGTVDIEIGEVNSWGNYWLILLI